MSEATKRVETLRKRYGERPDPTCWLCKGPMDLHGAGPGGLSWYCASVKYLGGTEAERQHFSGSATTTYHRTDDDVLWLIAEYERLVLLATEPPQ